MYKYHYHFFAYFISGLFNYHLLQREIPAAVRCFNQLSRKIGQRMQISVTIDAANQCLEIILYTEQPKNGNYLRVTQFFSKELATRLSMYGYIVRGRLLTA